MKSRFFLIIAVCSIALNAFAQKQFDFSDAASRQRMEHDVCLLASDSLMGREAGTAGEMLSRMFIASQFKEAGIQPFFGDTSWFRSFIYNDDAYIASGTSLKINGKDLQLFTDFYPLAYSINDTLSGETFYAGYGISAAPLNYDDYKNAADAAGKIFVIELGPPPGFDKNENILGLSGKFTKIITAVEKGAIAVVFVCSDSAYGHPSTDPLFYYERATIPVVFVTQCELLSKTGNEHLDLGVNIDVESRRSAYNVAGWINNKAEYSIVIGGHYDHLGKGDFGARSGGGENNFFYGADDNASGTAGVMELARWVKTSGLKNYNYIFVAFSAEEKGLIGSSRFLSDSSINPATVSCMIDLDMIGRMNKKNELKVFGVGTSKEWKSTLKISDAGNLKLVKIKSGAGGSDHMPFYYHGIPDIFIHTGLHPDYHTPKDVCESVNFGGMVLVVQYVQNIIKTLDNSPKLTFKTVPASRMFFDLIHFL